MNAAGLAANAMLSQYVVHDLNADPILPFPDASFDAATCCVSVDYLTNPITVFTEVGRVLRSGGAFVVSVARGGEPPPGAAPPPGDLGDATPPATFRARCPRAWPLPRRWRRRGRRGRR